MKTLTEAAEEYARKFVTDNEDCFETTWAEQWGLVEHTKSFIAGATYMTEIKDTEISRLRLALESIYEKVGACPFSENDRWGYILEVIYKKSQNAIALNPTQKVDGMKLRDNETATLTDLKHHFEVDGWKLKARLEMPPYDKEVVDYILSELKLEIVDGWIVQVKP